MDAHSISKALKLLRTKCGLSLLQLAGRVNTSVATLSRYENGWERFELYTLNKIANSLGYKLDIQFKPIKTYQSPKTISGVIKRIKRLFWDKKITESDLKSYPLWVVERVIEYGDIKDVHALINLLGKKRFLKIVADCRLQSAKTRSFWLAILEREGVKCTKRFFPREQKIY